MGVTSLILSLIALCTSWIPGIGWLGVIIGVVACALGVPSITHWFEKPGYTGWGIAGISIGATSTGVGFAFQIKHAAGNFDILYHSLPVPVAYYVDRLSGSKRVKLKFLKGEAWFPTNAFLLAAITGAPVCGAWSFCDGMRSYNCHGVGPFDCKDGKEPKDRKTQVEAMARQFANCLEIYVKKYPKQWFNFFDFWSDT